MIDRGRVNRVLFALSKINCLTFASYKNNGHFSVHSTTTNRVYFPFMTAVWHVRCYSATNLWLFVVAERRNYFCDSTRNAIGSHFRMYMNVA